MLLSSTVKQEGQTEYRRREYPSVCPLRLLHLPNEQHIIVDESLSREQQKAAVGEIFSGSRTVAYERYSLLFLWCDNVGFSLGCPVVQYLDLGH